MSTKFTWEKIGQIFDPTKYSSPSWMEHYGQSPSTLLLPDRIRIFFSCRPKPQDGYFISLPAYADFTRDHTFKLISISSQPVLSLGQRGCFDEFGIYPFSVYSEPDEDPTVHAYYAGWTRCESVPFNVSIGYATSTNNGESFQRAFPGPIMSFTDKEPFILSSPRIRKFNGLWYLFYISGERWIQTETRPEPVYKIRYATSTDGIFWERSGKNIIPTILPVDEAQASPDVIFYRGRYHMFFCYRDIVNYKLRSHSYRLGYASSTDLVMWQRDDELSTFASQEVSTQDWDYDMQSYPHVFCLDDCLYMLYMGNEFGRYGFGISKLTTDA